MNEFVGWLNVYKPVNITSFGVIRKIKHHFNVSKIGHVGTLDPLAEGILPIAIGISLGCLACIGIREFWHEFEIAFKGGFQ